MKTLATITLTLLLVAAMAALSPSGASAQTCEGAGPNFVDLDGDGFNDNAPDADGDGIPNGLDPDYIHHAQDGTGYQHKGDNAKGEAAMAQARVMAMTFYRLQAFCGFLYQYNYAYGMQNGGLNGAGVCDGSGGGTANSGGSGAQGTRHQGGN